MRDAVHGIRENNAHTQSVRDGMKVSTDQGAALPASIADATADLPPLDAAIGEPATPKDVTDNLKNIKHNYHMFVDAIKRRNEQQTVPVGKRGGA